MSVLGYRLAIHTCWSLLTNEVQTCFHHTEYKTPLCLILYWGSKLVTNLEHGRQAFHQQVIPQPSLYHFSQEVNAERIMHWHDTWISKQLGFSFPLLKTLTESPWVETLSVLDEMVLSQLTLRSFLSPVFQDRHFGSDHCHTHAS